MTATFAISDSFWHLANRPARPKNDMFGGSDRRAEVIVARGAERPMGFQHRMALLAALIAGALVLAAPAGAAGGMEVTRQGDVVDLNIPEATSLDEVLAALAEAFGATMQGEVGGPSVGPLRLAGVTLNEALVQLLPNRSFTMKFAEGATEPATIIVMGGTARPVEASAQPVLQLQQQPQPAAVGLPLGLGQLIPFGKGPAAPNGDIARTDPLRRFLACQSRGRLGKPNQQGAGGKIGTEGDPCAPPALAIKPVTR
jgi:hypothetical protein